MDDYAQLHPGAFAARTPDRPAVIMAGSGRVITFADFEALSNQCAHLLRSLGLARGDRVSILMENHPLYLPLAWGSMRAGLRVTAISTHLGSAEVDYILTDNDSQALLTSHAMAATAGALEAAGVPAAARLMADRQVAGFGDLDAALAAQTRTPIGDQSEGVEMLYSSGTTGRPKGVKKPLSDNPFGEPAAWHRTMMKLYEVDERSIYLSPAPLYHAAPLMFNIRSIRFGGTSVVMEKFDAESALALIEKYQITHSQWVPTHFIRMLRLPDDVRARYDLSSHRVAVHAAAPCPIDVKRQMIGWWGPIIREYYAGSEGNGYCAIDSADWLAKPGSVGRALIGTLRICNDAGKVLPNGTPGTVFFEGGPVFDYHNDPDKTAESRHPKGWSTLGDIGYVDDEGFLFLTDRRAFTIISGGVNIYPQECENVLASHPQVYDVAVIGVPNAEFGEEVKAVVQAVDPAAAGADLAAALMAHCRARLSHVKCPRSIDFVDQLPRQENGKLYKQKLRARYWTDGAALPR